MVTTEALIFDCDCAPTVIASPSVSQAPAVAWRPRMAATVLVLTALIALAPAPASATPTRPPPIAAEAAKATELMVARLALSAPAWLRNVHWAPVSTSTSAQLVPCSMMVSRSLSETVSPALTREVRSVLRSAASPVKSLSTAISSAPEPVVSVRAASSSWLALKPVRPTAAAGSPVIARMLTPVPTESVTRRLSETTASTSFATSFTAVDTPTETATPTRPAPMASETAPASEVIWLSSSARTDTSRASMIDWFSIAAVTVVAIRLRTPTPAPATPTPTIPPATAADPASTFASICWVLSAVTETLPWALILLSSIVAEMVAPVRVRSTRRQSRVS